MLFRTPSVRHCAQRYGPNCRTIVAASACDQRRVVSRCAGPRTQARRPVRRSVCAPDDHHRPPAPGPAGRSAACRVDVAIATGRRRDWLARAGFRAGSDSIDPGARARRHRHGARQRLPPRAGACLPSDHAGCCSIRCETYSSRSDAVAPVILDPGNATPQTAAGGAVGGEARPGYRRQRRVSRGVRSRCSCALRRR